MTTGPDRTALCRKEHSMNQHQSRQAYQEMYHSHQAANAAHHRQHPQGKSRRRLEEDEFDHFESEDEEEEEDEDEFDDGEGILLFPPTIHHGLHGWDDGESSDAPHYDKGSIDNNDNGTNMMDGCDGPTTREEYERTISKLRKLNATLTANVAALYAENAAATNSTATMPNQHHHHHHHHDSTATDQDGDSDEDESAETPKTHNNTAATRLLLVPNDNHHHRHTTMELTPTEEYKTHNNNNNNNNNPPSYSPSTSINQTIFQDMMLTESHYMKQLSKYQKQTHKLKKQLNVQKKLVAQLSVNLKCAAEKIMELNSSSSTANTSSSTGDNNSVVVVVGGGGDQLLLQQQQQRQQRQQQQQRQQRQHQHIRKLHKELASLQTLLRKNSQLHDTQRSKLLQSYNSNNNSNSNSNNTNTKNNGKQQHNDENNDYSTNTTNGTTTTITKNTTGIMIMESPEEIMQRVIHSLRNNNVGDFIELRGGDGVGGVAEAKTMMTSSVVGDGGSNNNNNNSRSGGGNNSHGGSGTGSISTKSSLGGDKKNGDGDDDDDGTCTMESGAKVRGGHWGGMAGESIGGNNDDRENNTVDEGMPPPPKINNDTAVTGHADVVASSFINVCNGIASTMASVDQEQEPTTDSDRDQNNGGSIHSNNEPLAKDDVVLLGERSSSGERSKDGDLLSMDSLSIPHLEDDNADTGMLDNEVDDALNDAEGQSCDILPIETSAQSDVDEAILRDTNKHMASEDGNGVCEDDNADSDILDNEVDDDEVDKVDEADEAITLKETGEHMANEEDGENGEDLLGEAVHSTPLISKPDESNEKEELNNPMVRHDGSGASLLGSNVDDKVEDEMVKHDNAMQAHIIAKSNDSADKASTDEEAVGSVIEEGDDAVRIDQDQRVDTSPKNEEIESSLVRDVVTTENAVGEAVDKAHTHSEMESLKDEPHIACLKPRDGLPEEPEQSDNMGDSHACVVDNGSLENSDPGNNERNGLNHEVPMRVVSVGFPENVDNGLNFVSTSLPKTDGSVDVAANEELIQCTQPLDPEDQDADSCLEEINTSLLKSDEDSYSENENKFWNSSGAETDTETRRQIHCKGIEIGIQVGDSLCDSAGMNNEERHEGDDQSGAEHVATTTETVSLIVRNEQNIQEAEARRTQNISHSESLKNEASNVAIEYYDDSDDDFADQDGNDSDECSYDAKEAKDGKTKGGPVMSRSVIHFSLDPDGNVMESGVQAENDFDEDEYYVAKEGKDLDGVCSVIDDDSGDFEEPDGTVAISLGKPDDASVNIDEMYDSVNGVSMAFGANGVATGTAHDTLQCNAASDPEIIPITSIREASAEIRPEKKSNPKQPINADHPTETPRGQHMAATKLCENNETPHAHYSTVLEERPDKTFDEKLEKKKRQGNKIRANADSTKSWTIGIGNTLDEANHSGDESRSPSHYDTGVTLNKKMASTKLKTGDPLANRCSRRELFQRPESSSADIFVDFVDDIQDPDDRLILVKSRDGKALVPSYRPPVLPPSKSKDGPLFSKGNKDGYYVYKSSTGNEYRGHWKDGRRHGYGIAKYREGEVYSGEWRRGRRNGYGTLHLANSEVFDGGWDANKKHGLGVYFWSDGEADVSWYEHDVRKESLRWTNDRRRAYRLDLSSSKKEPIQLQEAAQLVNQWKRKGAVFDC